MLAEIREDAARPPLADVYADIRNVLDVPMVNLIYRHIATFSGALAWAWEALRPHIVANEIEPVAQRLLAKAEETPWRRPTPLRDATASQRAEVNQVVSWYNRSNATNLIALLALRHANVRYQAGPSERGDVRRTGARDTLPPPALLADVVAPLRARIESVADRQGLTTAGVTPTMYLHLARWPQILEQVLNYVDTAIDSGELERTVRAIDAVARPEAMRLASALTSALPPPTDEDRHRINAALETFTGIAIPQMIAVGTHLRSSN